MNTTRYDDPLALAGDVLDLPRPTLVGLDVDGVLAPIVAHAAQARLLDGTVELLRRLTSVPTLHLAVISGRSLDDLQRFSFPEGVTQIGSHGMERAGQRIVLDDVEDDRRHRLDELARSAATEAGPGAWVEPKPASIVLHIREAELATATAAVAALAANVEEIHGAVAMHGSSVLELFVRHGDKGSAMSAVRNEMAAESAVYVGDDVTDERAFAALAPGDISIKVGDAETLAGHRLHDPEAVQTFLVALADGFDATC